MYKGSLNQKVFTSDFSERREGVYILFVLEIMYERCGWLDTPNIKYSLSLLKQRKVIPAVWKRVLKCWVTNTQTAVATLKNKVCYYSCLKTNVWPQTCHQAGCMWCSAGDCNKWDDHHQAQFTGRVHSLSVFRWDCDCERLHGDASRSPGNDKLPLGLQSPLTQTLHRSLLLSEAMQEQGRHIVQEALGF